jgi:hypothetical protein
MSLKQATFNLQYSNPILNGNCSKDNGVLMTVIPLGAKDGVNLVQIQNCLNVSPSTYDISSIEFSLSTPPSDYQIVMKIALFICDVDRVKKQYEKCFASLYWIQTFTSSVNNDTFVLNQKLVNERLGQFKYLDSAKGMYLAVSIKGPNLDDYKGNIRLSVRYTLNLYNHIIGECATVDPIGTFNKELLTEE